MMLEFVIAQGNAIRAYSNIHPPKLEVTSSKLVHFVSITFTIPYQAKGLLTYCHASLEVRRLHDDVMYVY